MLLLYDYKRPECEFLAKSLSPNEVEDKLFDVNHSIFCSRESEASANFEWQMLFQCLNDFRFFKFIIQLLSINSLFISLLCSIFYILIHLVTFLKSQVTIDSNKFHFYSKI